MTSISILAQARDSFWMPDRASTSAAEVDSTFAFIAWVSLFFFALIVTLMVVFVIRYRRRRGYSPEKAPTSHLGIELIWTAIPLVVVISIFYVGFTTYLHMTTPPDNTYEIKVIAQRWKWLFQYPNGWVDDVLHVPGDRAILLTMRSEDVIHSLSIPEFRVKMDVVPGRYTKTWFKAKRPGTYVLLCAEYCGTDHSNMITDVVVHEPGGYEKWLKESSNLLSPYLRPDDVTDAAAIAGRLKDGAAPIDKFIRENLASTTRGLLDAWDASMPVSDDLKAALVDDLNEILKNEKLYQESRFAGVRLADDTKALLEKKEVAGEELAQLNRFLVSDAYPDALTRGPDMVEAGRYIYERKGGCASCHTLDGKANIGPSFLGKWGEEQKLKGGGTVVVDENYVRESILDPQAKIAAGYEPVMPTYKGRLSDQEIDAIIAFLKTLQKQ